MNGRFLQLGGDAISGAALLTKRESGVWFELPIELLYRNAATVAGMARAIEAVRSPMHGTITGYMVSHSHPNACASPVRSTGDAVPARAGSAEGLG